MPKPELGTVKVGDTLYVIEPDRRGSGPVETRVTKTGRIWIELCRSDWVGDPQYPDYRMRLDTQTSGRSSGNPWHFLTPAQLAWRDRERMATEYLKEQGLYHWELNTRSGPWRGRLLELANIIRVHEGLPEL